jgi:hypothetical protein
MGEVSFGDKISWFLYQKGMGTVRPMFLHLATFADSQWFEVAQTLIKDNHREGRHMILDQVLQPRRFKSHPKRNELLRLLGQFLSKGILDERRRVVQFIDTNPTLFSTTDDPLYGPLLTAQRDSDIMIANTAESALKKLKGEDSEPLL